ATVTRRASREGRGSQALLARGALSHHEPPFPLGTLAPLAFEEPVDLNSKIADGFNDALQFVPRDVLHDLVRCTQYDLGAVASKCEILFALHLTRNGVPPEDAGPQVERFALLIELWKTVRAEE